MAHNNTLPVDPNILRGSWMENIKWARELNELYGANHPKAKEQWELCNQLVKEMNEHQVPEKCQQNDIPING